MNITSEFLQVPQILRGFSSSSDYFPDERLRNSLWSCVHAGSSPEWTFLFIFIKCWIWSKLSLLLGILSISTSIIGISPEWKVYRDVFEKEIVPDYQGTWSDSASGSGTPWWLRSKSMMFLGKCLLKENHRKQKIIYSLQKGAFGCRTFISSRRIVNPEKIGGTQKHFPIVTNVHVFILPASETY